jgi:hypothetical protein
LGRDRPGGNAVGSAVEHREWPGLTETDVSPARLVAGFLSGRVQVDLEHPSSTAAIRTRLKQRVPLGARCFYFSIAAMRAFALSL